MEFICYEDEYKEMIEILHRHIDAIIERANEDWNETWHFYDFMQGTCEEDKEILANAIETVLNDFFISCSVKNGCESITIIFDNYDKVLKLSTADISCSNELIFHLPNKYQIFFNEYEHIGTIKNHYNNGFIGSIYLFVQDKVDCDKNGASKNDYSSSNSFFRSEAVLATIGEYLVNNGEYNEVKIAIKNFIEACELAFEEADIYGEIDVHNGNWGMRNGVPIIFDPIFFG